MRERQAGGGGALGERPPGLSLPPEASGPFSMLRGFRLVHKKITINFQPISSTFISAQKTTTIILLKTSFLRISSNQIIQNHI